VTRDGLGGGEDCEDRRQDPLYHYITAACVCGAVLIDIEN